MPVSVQELAHKVQAFAARREYGKALDAIAKFRRHSPDHAVPAQLEGDLYATMLDFDSARRSYRRAVQLDPGLWRAWNNLANVERYAGHRAAWHDSAFEAIKRCPDPFAAARLHSNYLVQIHAFSDLTREQVVAAIRAWAEWHAPANPASVSECVPSTRSDRLRVALVSGAWDTVIFRNLLAPLLDEFDGDRFEIHAVNTSDPEAHPFGPLSAHVKTHHVAGPTLLHLRGRFDVCVDLDGHSPTGSLPAFAARIAPVQVSWFDWFDTTGVRTMDHWIGDNYSNPASDDDSFVENVVRLDRFRLCCPSPGRLSARATTAARRPDWVFGVIARREKHSDAAIAAWAEILRRVPRAVLRLKLPGGEAPAVQRTLVRRFGSLGVAPDRVRFFGASSYAEYLAFLADCDLILDSFPYNGGASCFDALSQGVPVVTVVGESPVSRQTAAVLRELGLAEFACESSAAFVERAVAIALAGPDERDDRLSKSGLRERFVQSRICDRQGFVRAFERALLEVSALNR